MGNVMQDRQMEDQTGHLDMRKTRLAERQARVGIIANTTTVALPAHPPREIWTRWPRLRSGRRQGARKPAEHIRQLQDDAVMSGDLLRDLRRDLCAQDAADSPGVDRSDHLPAEPSFAPPQLRAQPVIILAVSVLLGALVLIGLSVLLD